MMFEHATSSDTYGASVLYVAIGTVFLAGLILDKIGRWSHVPRVSLLMLLGLALGPHALGLLPGGFLTMGGTLTPLALTMVAFLLGGRLERRKLYAHGREILAMSLVVVAISSILVGGGLWSAGVAVVPAILLGAISSATAPAATLDVIRQSGRTDKFATTLQGIVALDDVWGLLVFSLALTLAGTILGEGSGALWLGLHEVAGSILLGVAIGLPGAALTGRLKPGEPTLIEALGLVFLTTGLALYLDLSFLLAGMTAGVFIVNFARHHDRPFHEIERIEWPFLLLFFVLAGAGLDLASLGTIGLVGIVYVVLRCTARAFGGLAGARLAGIPAREGLLTGLALMPQAGVAIGMAVIAAERFPEYGPQILTVTVATTVVFELIGPILTQSALAHAARNTPMDG